MTYQEAINDLYSRLPMFSRVGAAAYKPGLERSYRLARFFGNPQEKLRAIHIAGTNGKGSTSHLIASVLQSAGYKTALYTSPHLVDFRERMRINGKMIPRERVIEFVEKWQKADYPGDSPSFFELTMMMAFDWFASEKVDFAVIEVGMGGRLDSTNIISPILSVITNISFDHTQFLGTTLAEIAGEKAGIIKPGIPVVVSEAEGEVEEVFRSRATEAGAPLREAYREFELDLIAGIECPLRGPYQKWNINAARIAVDELRKLGIPISSKAEAEGFQEVERQTGLRGRWTIVSDAPLTICDTGHNEAGLRYNLSRLRELVAERPAGSSLRFVIGFVADKDVDHILPMFPKDAKYYLSQAAIPRAMPVEALLGKCKALGLDAIPFPTPADAAEVARKESETTDIIYIGGSTFIVADYLAATEAGE